MMVSACLLLLILDVLLRESYAATVFDTNTCSDGCKTGQDCPANSHCVAVTASSDCGLCLCQAGYKSEGRECVPNDKARNGGGGTEIQPADQGTTSIAVFATTTTAAPTTMTVPGPTTQGPPPAPIPLNCADYACSPEIQNSDSDNPFTVRAKIFQESSNCKRKLNIPARPCKMGGGGVCYGTYCLSVEPGMDYCICPYYRVDRQCAVDKPGNCGSASGQLPATGYQAMNKRFRNKNRPDHGSVYGRHFSSNLNDCVKLCQWTNGACRSVNFGTLAGQQICELLSIAVTKGSPIEGWLVDALGWQHVQVV